MTTIISEGKTTNEAIENGLKQLNVSKKDVNIKVIEEEKRSFFSILTPKVVKVELTVKEEKVRKSQKREQTEINLSEEDFKKAESNIKAFLDTFIKQVKEELTYKIALKQGIVEVELQGKNAGFLIGYRGETLYAFQSLLTTIANKGVESRVFLRLDIENYKSKREKTLENLAKRTAETVIRTGKTITLEPMQAYERKIIHTKLQNSELVETRSIGEEPRRKIVISLKRK